MKNKMIKKLKKEEGITLITLAISVLVMIIIAGIAIYSGTESIKAAKLEGLKTNMLLIQAKVRGLVEEVNFQKGTHPENLESGKIEEIRNKVYVEEAGLEKADSSMIPPEINVDINNTYMVSETALNKIGLDQLEPDKYFIVFDEENVKAEVYNVDGYEGSYSLTEIDQIKIDM